VEEIIENVIDMKPVIKDWIKELGDNLNGVEVQDLCMDAYLRGIQDTLEAIEGEK